MTEQLLASHFPMGGNSSDNLEDGAQMSKAQRLMLKTEIRNYSRITIKHSPAELGGRGQRQAGVVKLVAIVTDADLKLDGIINVL